MTHTDAFRDVDGGFNGAGYNRLEKPSEFAAFRHFAYSRSIRFRMWRSGRGAAFRSPRPAERVRRAATGRLDPAITLMKSRGLVASPKLRTTPVLAGNLEDQMRSVFDQGKGSKVNLRRNNRSEVASFRCVMPLAPSE
jgi:hypothetical protein